MSRIILTRLLNILFYNVNGEESRVRIQHDTVNIEIKKECIIYILYRWSTISNMGGWVLFNWHWSSVFNWIFWYSQIWTISLTFWQSIKKKHNTGVLITNLFCFALILSWKKRWFWWCSMRQQIPPPTRIGARFEPMIRRFTAQHSNCHVIWMT